MSDNHPKIIKNSLSRPCKRCTGIHDYITKLSDDAPCDTPVAFSAQKAEKLSRVVARGKQDVYPVENDMIVVMDDSARKLPRGATGSQLAQIELTERHM